jgi:hypothetical protein
MSRFMCCYAERRYAECRGAVIHCHFILNYHSNFCSIEFTPGMVVNYSGMTVNYSGILTLEKVVLKLPQ